MILSELEQRSVEWLLDLQELSVRTVEHVVVIALLEWYAFVGDGACLGSCLPISEDYHVLTYLEDLR